MNISFIGILPSRRLEEALESHQFKLKVHKTILKSIAAESPEVIAFCPKTVAQMAHVKDIKATAPEASLILIVPTEWLNDTLSHNAILDLVEKDDVHLRETWELTFFIAIQSHIRRNAQASQLRSYTEITKKTEKLIQQFGQNVELALNIQRALLPKISPQIPGISLTVKFIPATGSGGDYYDLFEFGDRKRFGVLLADSDTHSMAASLLSVLLKVRIDELKERFPTSCDLVNHIHEELRSLDPKKASRLSLLYGILDRSNLSFRFTAAGQLTPLLWRQGAILKLPVIHNPSLGSKDLLDYRETEWGLKPGDLLILHTDGLYGPLTRKDKSGQKKIIELLESKKAGNDPIELRNEFLAQVDEFVESNKLKDDLTLIQISIDERALYVAQA